jgi:uncharacterized cupredoxin-like copper-binding protein
MRAFSALAAASFILLGSAVAFGHGGDAPYGEPGDLKAPARTVTIVMEERDNGDMVYVPRAVEVKLGEQVRFVLRNHGKLDHEFVIGTEGEIDEHALLMKKFPEMEHDEPNMKRVQPGAEGELVWKFTVAGEFDFACLIPGHIESGMFGSITVK